MNILLPVLALSLALCRGLTAQEKASEKLEKVWTIKAPFGVQCVAFSPDGNTLAAGGYSTAYDIILLDSSNGDTRKSWVVPKDAPKSVVTGIGYGSDTILVTGGLDGFVRQWDVRSGKQTKGHSLGPVGDGPVEDSGRIYDLVTSPDGKMCAATLWERIVILKSSSLEETVRLAGHPPDLRNKYQPHGGLVGLSFSRDGSKLASASNEAVLKIWDVKSGKEVRSIKTCSERPYGLYYLGLSSDGKLVAAGGDDNTVKVWDVATGKLLMTGSHVEMEPHFFEFSPSGSTIASCNSRTIVVWDVASGRELAQIATEHGVDAMALSRDGALLAIGNITTHKISVYRWIGPKTATEGKK
jgi:WD40 repeat protein